MPSKQAHGLTLQSKSHYAKYRLFEYIMSNCLPTDLANGIGQLCEYKYLKAVLNAEEE